MDFQNMLFSTSDVSALAATSTGITPRDYQAAALNATFDAFDLGAPGALCRLPTGGGKTFVGALAADAWLKRDEANRVMILAHERQLVWQFAEEINAILKTMPAIEMARDAVTGADMPLITVASRQTLIQRGEQVGDTLVPVSRLYKFHNTKYNWLLIIDECHRWKRSLASCQHIIEWFEANAKSRRLGLTATPERSDKVSLRGLFPSIASDYRLWDHAGGSCAVRDGWAVPYLQKFITVESINFEDLEEVKGDFTDEELTKFLGETREVAKLVDPLLDMVGDRKTVIFSPSVDMARKVAHQINAEIDRKNREGIDLKGVLGGAMSLDGGVPEATRKEVYRDYESGKFQFLSVCGLCREGWNVPSVSCVAIFRPTKIRSLAEQMKGRGCRPLPGLVDNFDTPAGRRKAIADSDKPYCLIVDLVGVTGLADTATTASIMAEGLPDEVIEKANELILNSAKSNQAVDVGELLVEADEEVARKKREEEEERLEKLRKAQKDAERQAAERAERRAAAGSKTTYHAREVDQGRQSIPTTRSTRPASVMITDKQYWFIKKSGLPVTMEMTKKEAGRLIGMLKRGIPHSMIEKKYRAEAYRSEMKEEERSKRIDISQDAPPPRSNSSRIPDDIFDVLR